MPPGCGPGGMRLRRNKKVSNKDYSAKHIFSLDACTNCQICADVCPAVQASSSGSLSGVHRIQALKKIMKGRMGGLWKFLGYKDPSEEELKEYADTVFRCTLCGHCQLVCPAGIELKDIWLSLRQDLNKSQAAPSKVQMIKDNLESSHNVFDEENEERADWTEDMDEEPEDQLVKDSAKVVYFTGCVAAFFPMAQQIPVALAEILQASQVDFTLLGEEEWCCGFPLLGAGMLDHAKELIEHNIEAVKEKGATQVVFACPSCYQMWREHYDHPFEIFHATQFLEKLLKEGKVPLREKKIKVTYHDPCDLGRGAGEYRAPREVLKMLPGVEFVELAKNQKECQCCGGGGNLEMIDANLSAEISKRKIDQVLETGADAVISACQQCVRTMATHTRRNKVKLKVMDITQLIHQQLDV